MSGALRLSGNSDVVHRLSNLETEHDELKEDHAALTQEVRETLVPRVDKLEEAAAGLRLTIQEIKARLDTTASREDILGLELRLGSRIDSGINGILSKALDSVPESHALSINRQMMVWTAVIALVAVAGLLWKWL